MDKELHNKVILITGAAQGIANAVCKGCAKEGATLIMADINAPKLEEAVKELQTEVGCLAGMTCQRITHMLTALVKSGVLVKNYVKKTPFYSVA